MVENPLRARRAATTRILYNLYMYVSQFKGTAATAAVS